MTHKRISATSMISTPFVEQVCHRLAEGKTVRRALPGGGRLHIDRRVPFLCLYRETSGTEVGDTSQLVIGEAAYIVAPGTAELQAGLKELVNCISDVMVDAFGAFLLLEIWTADARVPRSEGRSVQAPTFRIITSSLSAEDATVRQLHMALSEIPLRPPPLDVEIVAAQSPAPPSLAPILPHPPATAGLRHTVGIEVQPVYRQARTGTPYPVLFETLRRGLSVAIKQTAYHFSLLHTGHEPLHYHSLGRRTTVRAASDADAELTSISRSFEFLLQVTPVNSDRARMEFIRTRAEIKPEFDYRPLVVDVDLLKRRLYNLPLERLEDPTLAHLLSASREELDRKITMLGDRNTSRFMYGSLAVYGSVSEGLHEVALELLARAGPSTKDDVEDGGPHGNGRVNATGFARMAEEELELYRVHYPELSSTVRVRDDVVGLLVSDGNLLIGSRLSVPESRARALIQHEIGTHVITYSNGLAQPLGLLATGLAGYEEIQEGLAVTAEFLAGALSPARVRVLAARVITVRGMIDGASFVDSFRALTRAFGFADYMAFTICMRVYRSGGLTKDAIYLRGLAQFLEYLRDGGDLEPLLLGKISISNVPEVQELRWREYLLPPRLVPRFLTTPGAADTMVRLRKGLTVLDLLTEATQ